MSPTLPPEVWTCQVPWQSKIKSTGEYTLPHLVQADERSLSCQRTSPPQEGEKPRPRCPLILGNGQAFSLSVPPPPSDLISYLLCSLGSHHPALLASLEHGRHLTSVWGLLQCAVV